jgi:hypothetical protein
MTSDWVNSKAGSRPHPDADALDPLHGIDFSKLERSLRRPRTFMSLLFSVIISAMTLLALIPLFSVLGLLVWRGGRKLSLAALHSASAGAARAERRFWKRHRWHPGDLRYGAAHQPPYRNFQRDLPGAIEDRKTAGLVGTLRR